MMKIYQVTAQDLNNAKAIYFDTYKNAYDWVMKDNWYFGKAIFEIEIVAGERGILDGISKKVFEKN